MFRILNVQKSCNSLYSRYTKKIEQDFLDKQHIEGSVIHTRKRRYKNAKKTGYLLITKLCS